MAEEKIQIDFPKDYYLISTTICVNGNRLFIDIPMYTHRLVFPNRDVIYRFTCERAGVAPDTADKSTFAVMNVFKFANEEDYQSYIG